MLSPIAVERVAVDRFHREISLTKKLNHENIVGFIDDGVAGSIFYFIMEFCNSGDLAQFAFQRGGILPLKVCLPIMLQCLRGLEHAHVEGVVHRDLKPANVLLHQIENKYVAKISDFGLAKSFDASGLSGLTATGSGGGTMPYMPREQLTQFKDVRPASDVWSFAATFYTILTGRLPRAASETADPLQVILEVDATPIRQHLPSLPDAVAAVFDQALLSDTSRRYQDGGELRRALRKAVS
jgi:serine/threonine protein kinase